MHGSASISKKLWDRIACKGIQTIHYYCNQLNLMIFRYNSTFCTLIYSTFNSSNPSIYKIVVVTLWALRKCSQNTKLYHIRKNQQLRKKKHLSSVTYFLHDKFNPNDQGTADYYQYCLTVLSIINMAV